MDKKKSFTETIEAEILHHAQDYVKEKVTKKIIRVGEVSVSFLLGFILLIIGIVEIVGKTFPVLEGGFNYLIFGILFLLVGFMLK